MPSPPDPQAALGQAVRELRKERNLTQEELAHLADLHPTWISRLETGRRNPAWANMRRICDALGVQISDLARRAETIEHKPLR